VGVSERGQPGRVLVADRLPVLASLLDDGVEVAGVPQHDRVEDQYYAALLFFLAVSVTHNGVWGERQNRMLVPHDDWLCRSIKETARAYSLAILCAWLLGTIGRSLGDIVEAIPYVIVWSGLGLLISPGSSTRSRRQSGATADAEASGHDRARTT
jgi:hypothetical protein